MDIATVITGAVLMILTALNLWYNFHKSEKDKAKTEGRLEQKIQTLGSSVSELQISMKDLSTQLTEVRVNMIAEMAAIRQDVSSGGYCNYEK